jgi:hypothetical protein
LVLTFSGKTKEGRRRPSFFEEMKQAVLNGDELPETWLGWATGILAGSLQTVFES